MRISRLSAVDFRNIEQVRLAFDGDRHFFHGPNGQGKTNLLEAIGLLTALRSFRTNDLGALVRWDRREAGLLFRIEHEHHGETQVEFRLRKTTREILWDGEKQPRFSDFVGRFPVVPMSSQDIQLLRGSPGLRRRFIDLTFSAIDADYMGHLRRYHRALQERNRLLKQRAGPAELTAFERILIPAGTAIMAGRRRHLERFGCRVADHYHAISQTDEAPAFRYKPDIAGAAEADAQDEAFARILHDNRERDTILKSTSKGPHRDEITFGVFGRSAETAGSEGQQRGLVLALRLAQADLFRDAHQTEPIILADDVLGELDAHRRAAFWQAVSGSTQVFATGTRPPEAAGDLPWVKYTVSGGEVSRS